ncbi:MAG: hypothetical protein ACK4KV_19055 [Rhodocyclaceae bacterium]
MIQIDTWALISFFVGLAVTIVGGIVGAAKYSLAQSERRQDERHASSERARLERARHWDERFASLEAAAKADAGQWKRVERELLDLKASLPVTYVMREDDIRRQSVIEAKIDGLAVKFENMILRGQHG